MHESQQNRYPDEPRLIDIFSILWKKKVFILSSVFLAIVVVTIISLFLPNIYKSEAILSPANDNGSSLGMLGQYSTMASLAGISLPNEPIDKSLEAIERIKSFEFFSNHFLPNILLEDLMAVKAWDPTSNKLTYKKKYFDSGKWVRKFKYPQTAIPSHQEGYKVYREIMLINQNKQSGFVTISVKHQSRFIAEEWNNIIIKEINKSMRDEDKQKAIKSLDFLNNRSLEVNYEEIRDAIFALQQEQIKSLMMIESNENYIFNIIDPPIAPELKSEPNRPLIIILGAILAFFVSTMFILISGYIKINLSNSAKSI
tara:strand:- start:21170 stop:22108 length:939 start_codon:yes stop_codon:yes gene_type:complete